MAHKKALISLIRAMAVAVLIVAAVLSAVAVTALAGWSKELTTVVVIAGAVIAASLAALATVDG